VWLTLGGCSPGGINKMKAPPLLDSKPFLSFSLSFCFLIFSLTSSAVLFVPIVCGGGGGGVSAEGSNSHHHHVARDVSFVLHDALESSGILASHARVKRTSPIFLFSFVQFSDALKNGLKSVSRKEGRDSVLRSGNSRTSRGKPVFFFN
jgi:hypothetical protein